MQFRSLFAKLATKARDKQDLLKCGCFGNYGMSFGAVSVRLSTRYCFPALKRLLAATTGPIDEASVKCTLAVAVNHQLPWAPLEPTWATLLGALQH
jgi:hypothetical protein